MLEVVAGHEQVADCQKNLHTFLLMIVNEPFESRENGLTSPEVTRTYVSSDDPAWMMA